MVGGSWRSPSVGGRRSPPRSSSTRSSPIVTPKCGRSRRAGCPWLISGDAAGAGPGRNGEHRKGPPGRVSAPAGSRRSAGETDAAGAGWEQEVAVPPPRDTVTEWGQGHSGLSLSPAKCQSRGGCSGMGISGWLFRGAGGPYQRNCGEGGGQQGAGPLHRPRYPPGSRMELTAPTPPAPGITPSVPFPRAGTAQTVPEQGQQQRRAGQWLWQGTGGTVGTAHGQANQACPCPCALSQVWGSRGAQPSPESGVSPEPPCRISTPLIKDSQAARDLRGLLVPAQRPWSGEAPEQLPGSQPV